MHDSIFREITEPFLIKFNLSTLPGFNSNEKHFANSKKDFNKSTLDETKLQSEYNHEQPVVFKGDAQLF